MADLAAVPPNGLTAVSTFSGCGGSSVGLRMAGWRVPYAVEFVSAAARTYRANSDALVDERDIREIPGAEILDSLGLAAGELDLLEGSPPCFPAGTPIQTFEGRKAIEDVREGDRVLTHRGRYRKVRALAGRVYSGDWVKLSLKYGRDPLELTADHPVFAQRAVSEDRGDRGWTYLEPQWIAAGDLQPRDRLLEPALRQRLTPPRLEVKLSASIRPWQRGNRILSRPLALDVDSGEMAWMLGLYIAEGWRRGKNPELGVTGASRRGVTLALAPDEVEEVQERAVAAGLRASDWKGVDTHTAHKLTVAPLDYWVVCGEFGDGAGGKRIPEWAQGMPKPWRAELLGGYLWGDGPICLPGP